MIQKGNKIKYIIKADKGYTIMSGKAKHAVIPTLPRNSWDSKRVLYRALERR
jgi:hypothetical protein